ncbi:GNAT family N-acetyltransferase [Frigidibacter sp. MR17.14]|uniref:GNAT family N-acetyltransferase n=1 Tax=Frigidibacter sp. MR17.14 TaxID=3126509 RepID=UPI0030129D97
MPEVIRDSRTSSTAQAAPARRAEARLEVAVIDDPAALAGPWQALADRAEVVNPFLEPWFLGPALQAWGAAEGASLAVLHAPGSGALQGLVALRPRARLAGLPLAHLEGWRHGQAFLGAPLIAPGQAARVWAALGRHCAAQGARALVLHDLPAALPLPPGAVRLSSLTRAALVPHPAGAAAYLAASASAGARKDWRRLRRRLAEQGALELRRLAATEDPGPWIDAFLRLELAGWKGRAGTALASCAAGERFFRAMATGAARLGRLRMIGLWLEGRPVALQCNLVSGRQGFAFKVAHDETLAAFSPGVLLELDAVAAFHDEPRLAAVDSCTAPDNAMIARIWAERIALQRVLLPAEGAAGALAGAAVRAAAMLRGGRA